MSEREQTPALVRLGMSPVVPMTVADSTTEFDKAGHQECLRFPPFPQEMLMDQWWSAGEDLGRVRVVITEGLARGQGQPGAFRRVKNVVSFSFQHAPLGRTLGQSR